MIESGNLIPGRLVGTGRILKSSTGRGVLSTNTASTFSGDLIVEDGYLRVSGLEHANYQVDGGALHILTDVDEVELRGGDLLLTNSMSGGIVVTESSRIATMEYFSLNPNFSGEITGSEDLTLGSQSRYDDGIQRLLISGESPNYSGNITVDSGIVDIRREASLGSGDITILPGGSLRLAPQQGNFENSRLDLPNLVFLQGGEIRGFTSVFRPQQLLGELRVTGHSRIRDMNVVGATLLSDESRLTTYGEGNIQFLGDLRIAGEAELEYGFSDINSSSSQLVQVLGTVSSDAQDAKLNLLARGLDEILLDASFHVSTGQSLEVLKNDETLLLEVSGSNKTVSGGGHLINSVSLREGATISPGDSPGTLQIGETIFSENSVYAWELDSPIGVPGANWDLLSVDGDLHFEATPENPWILEISLLNDFLPPLETPWLIATADQIIGMSEESLQIEVILPESSLLSIQPNQFEVFTQSGQLFLQIVPEPASCSLLLMGIWLVGGRGKQRNVAFSECR